MGNKVLLQDHREEDGNMAKGAHKARMRKYRDHNTQGKRMEGSYTFAAVMSNEYSTEQNSVLSKRKVVEINPRRISRIKKEVLEATFVGKRVFLRDGREHNGRDDKGVYRKIG